MSDGFYRAFEDEFRGSRELILERLQVYLPFIEPLHEHLRDFPALDLGCGRGEWLELAREQGYAAIGVDLDDGMLAACRERGLHVVNADALQYLRGLPDDSHSLITGFHIAEHLPFDGLRTLVDEALRVLHPGGLLILETPNPENLVVGTVGFYTDPTHLRPLPPQLLEFLPRHAGYARSAVIRLHAMAAEEAAVTEPEAALTLMDVLGGASADYAAVAQKSGTDVILAALTPAFQHEGSSDLHSLAHRYQQQLKNRFAAVSNELAQTRTQVEALLQAQARAEQYADELQRVYRSRSWRITAPLRRAQQALRQMTRRRSKPHGEQEKPRSDPAQNLPDERSPRE